MFLEYRHFKSLCISSVKPVIINLLAFFHPKDELESFAESVLVAIK